MRRVLPFILVAGFTAALSSASAQTTPTTIAPVPAAPAAPATAATPADNATAPATQNSDDIVSCRYEKTTGSLFSKRICHTQREWHQMTTDSRDTMDNIDAHDRLPGSGMGGN